MPLREEVPGVDVVRGAQVDDRKVGRSPRLKAAAEAEIRRGLSDMSATRRSSVSTPGLTR